jgi:hypothetical protein
MSAQRKSRFSSPEAALRFYFRASELIAGDTPPGIFSRRKTFLPLRGPNAFGDFLVLDSAFQVLSEVEVCVMEELFRPGSFGTPRRQMSDVFESVRRRFPNHHWTPRAISRMKQEALERVEEHLKRERLL